MMYGLGTHPLSLPMTNKAAVITGVVPSTRFFNRPRVSQMPNRPGVSYTATPGELIVWYDKGDATEVITLEHMDVLPSGVGVEMTPAQARFRFYIAGGNAYAQMLEGRNGERTAVTAWVRRTDGTLDSQTLVINVVL